MLKLDDLRSNIAIVPQDCVLFNDTILYNIAYGGVRDPEFKVKLQNMYFEEAKNEKEK